MVRLLKRWLPPRVVSRLKALNRVRWITKFRLLRGSGFWRAQPRAALAYLLLDPEIESYTYEIANEAELCRVVAEALGVDASEVERYCAEAHRDRELNELLAARVRWRPETKRRLPLGLRLLWYLLVRARKPDVVVETGVLMGLGSLVILRALEHNAADGHPGRLLSADTDAAAGPLVPGRLKGGWTLATGRSTEVLTAALRSSRVGIWFQDTPHTRENQNAEFGLALGHADWPLVLVDPEGGRSGALAAACDGYPAARILAFQPIVRRHFYHPPPTAIAVIPGPGGRV